MASSPLAGKSIGALLPSQVELREIALSFTLPKGKNLSRTVARELRTQFDSTVSLRVTPDSLDILCNPPILIDAQWPAKNLQFSGAAIRFAGTLVEAKVTSIHGVGEGFVDVTAVAEQEIRNLLNAGIAGTAMAKAGYDPLADPQVVATLESIKANFEQLPSSGSSDVSTADISRVAVEATVAMRNRFTFSKDGGGVDIPAGGALKLRVASTGNLASITSATTTEDRIRAANIQSLTLTSDALTLLFGGNPVTELQRVRVDRGGVVTIERMRLKGMLQDAADVESLVRVLAGAVALGAKGIPPEDALRMAAASPDAPAELVPGLTRQKIESILTEGIQTLIRDNATAIPGIDLQGVLIA